MWGEEGWGKREAWPGRPREHVLPVNADRAEIKNAGCAHHHIQGDKDVTVDAAEAPLTDHLERWEK